MPAGLTRPLTILAQGALILYENDLLFVCPRGKLCGGILSPVPGGHRPSRHVTLLVPCRKDRPGVCCIILRRTKGANLPFRRSQADRDAPD